MDSNIDLITKVFYEIDIAGIGKPMPCDEYSNEARILCMYADNKTTLQDLENLIRIIFFSQFCYKDWENNKDNIWPLINNKKYSVAAERIYAILRNISPLI